MITFNVGPSKVSQETKEDLKRAIAEGVLEVSHRSKEFTEISKGAVKGLKEFLGIPLDYQIVFTSSATESMQLAVQNCCQGRSFHFVNGNFSRLFAEISQVNGNQALVDEVESGKLNSFKNVAIDKEVDFVSITHNETSTGTMCSQQDIAKVRTANPAAILAIDITSSAGAVQLDFGLADIWIFSAQKCFGLPAGLGVLVLSPNALKKAKKLEAQGKNKAGIFTFSNLIGKMIQRYQTFTTPNVLGIYLLFRVLERNLQKGGLAAIAQEIEQKERIFNRFIENNKKIAYFVPEKQNRSKTVFCVRAPEELIEKIHKKCREKGVILGKGYGPLKQKTFRVANFPASTVADMQKLVKTVEGIL